MALSMRWTYTKTRADRQLARMWPARRAAVVGRCSPTTGLLRHGNRSALGVPRTGRKGFISHNQSYRT
jgi:hypothetical protein